MEGTVGFTIQNLGTLEIERTAKIICNCTGRLVSVAINNNDTMAIVRIIGGTVSAPYGIGINNFGILEIDGTATISGAKWAIYNRDGTVSIGEEVTIIGNTTRNIEKYNKLRY